MWGRNASVVEMGAHLQDPPPAHVAQHAQQDWIQQVALGEVPVWIHRFQRRARHGFPPLDHRIVRPALQSKRKSPRDHASGIADFPWATVHVHASEQQAALTPQTPREQARYRPRQWAHGPRWAT
jgi:hypothetical protein